MRSGLTSSNSASSRPTTEATMFKVPEGMLIKVVPPPPEDLTEVGQLWWNYYCTIFVEGNMLSRLFLTELHNLCILHQGREAMYRIVKLQGVALTTVRTNKDGIDVPETKTNPCWTELKDIIVKMDKLLGSMGMTAYSSKVNNFDSKGVFADANAPKGKTPPRILDAPPVIG